MSNKYLDRYKELYSEYIERAVNLHNYHKSFISVASYDIGLQVRKQLRAMVSLEKEMLKISRLAYQERLRLVREQRREEKAYKKANPQKRGPKPKGTKNI